jgi:hypothetical protein
VNSLTVSTPFGNANAAERDEDGPRLASVGAGT